MSGETAGEVSEEDVIVTVFERVEDTETRHRVISRTEDTSDEDFDVKYLTYQVKVNQSTKHPLSYSTLLHCLLHAHCCLPATPNCELHIGHVALISI